MGVVLQTPAQGDPATSASTRPPGSHRCQKEPLRIVHAAHDVDIGGMQKLLVEFARQANREHFALHFVSMTTRGRLADAIEKHSWPVTALEMPDGFRPGAILTLWRLLRKLRPDVVHAHDPKPLLYAPAAARLARVPVVIHTRHGRDYGLSRRQQWLTRWASRLVHRFVCVSEDSAQLSREERLAPGRVLTIRNGIDLTRFPPHGPTVGGPTVTVARLSAEKDLATLLRAVALVVQSWPGFCLEIAGDGPCRAELEQLTDELNLGAHVSFLGEVGDVPALFQRAALFVLPSRSEGISLTVLEAMASGLPVITTRVGGNPEVVEEGQTGLLVPSGDPPALAEAILTLGRDAEQAQAWGMAGRRRVEEHFDIRVTVARYEALYRTECGLVK